MTESANPPSVAALEQDTWINGVVEGVFVEFIEARPTHFNMYIITHEWTPEARTAFFAKFAAKCAEYAGCLP